ncbi:hypothetical protein GJ496_001502 [Pomphorhynchus laevis]|nr:hypothetical protein GJ496_001502 [Pomphorhynchus laevis]
MRRAFVVACWRNNSKITPCSVIIYVVYLLIGALIFSLIEQEDERNVIQNYQTVKLQFMTDYNITEANLNKFIFQLVELTSRGLNTTSSKIEPNWAFIRSLFFTSTLITTVGYGQVSPSSNGVERMLFICYRLISLLFVNHSFSDYQLAVTIFICLLLIIVVFFFALPTVLFYVMEESWSLLDSFYYCFISLSTIGLGDLVPGSRYTGTAGGIYNFAASAYIVTGVFSLTLLVGVSANIPQFNFARFYQINSDIRSENDESVRQRSIMHDVNNSARYDETEPSSVASSNDINDAFL